MSAFADYDARQIAALDAQAAAILSGFAARGYERADAAILQPAEIFLDRSGEEIRRRTFTFTDPSGRELCLRPDLTIPVCRMHLTREGGFPARLCYHGPVFRHQPAEPDRPTQFFQAGAELLGLEDRTGAEMEILSLAIDAAKTGGLAAFRLKIGDLGLFSAVIDALDVPPQWQSRLKRHFWRAGYFERLLVQFSTGTTTQTQRLLAHLGTLDARESRGAFEGLMDMIGEAPLGGRTRDEIVDRLIEQAADAAALRLDPRVAALIGQLLAVSGPAHAAVEEIRALTATAGVALEPWSAAMTARLDTLARLGVPPSGINFAARFGRNMEYYTGFVFELWARDREGDVQIAGGGRYDSLLEHLGAPRPVPAIGFTLRTERLLAAREFERA
ncbi:MAG TPA: ATP phosphoribosyltransferase regulatory subunit [Rhizomicrobium sp.]|jgi:ATP phosphoribosyltransferase regulatory subunit